MRNPYLAWVRDVEAIPRSLLAESFIAPALPRAGWLFDPYVLKLADHTGSAKPAAPVSP
jgi:hypothetical protein